jgi:hypothetical protein
MIFEVEFCLRWIPFEVESHPRTLQHSKPLMQRHNAVGSAAERSLYHLHGSCWELLPLNSAAGRIPERFRLALQTYESRGAAVKLSERFGRPLTSSASTSS